MKKLQLVGIILFSMVFNTSCENEPVNVKLDPNVYKPINDEIIEGLLKVSNYGIIDSERICVEFIYPFTILSFDSNYESVEANEISGSDQLVNFLQNLPEELTISMSYPISATLPNGSIISISNNEALIEALNACTEEDIILICNARMTTEAQCIVKIPFSSSGYDNKYAGGYFTGNSGGTVNFNYQNSSYIGTWTYLFINSELYFNIFLLGNTTVSQYWNKNFKVTINLNSTILNYGYDILLMEQCSSLMNYSIGQVGPNSGIIVHVKDNPSEGWKYIELSNDELPQEEWGCLNTSANLANNEEIGTGLMNSIAIANRHEEINYFVNPTICSNLNNGTVTAKTALLSDIANKNWFIPSIDELQLIYENIHLNGQGNFTNSVYWSSTQASANSSFGIDFTNGTVVEIPKNSSIAKSRKIIYF